MERFFCFAIVPDEQEQPTAAFRDLEDAMTWALARYGGDRFRIRQLALLHVETEVAPAPAHAPRS